MKYDVVLTLKYDVVSTLKFDVVSTLKFDVVSTLKFDVVSTLKSNVVSTLKSDVVSTLKSNVVSTLHSDVETTLKICCFPDVEIYNVVSTLKIGCSTSRPKINLKTTSCAWRLGCYFDGMTRQRYIHMNCCFWQLLMKRETRFQLRLMTRVSS